MSEIERQVFEGLLVGGLVAAAVVFILLFFVTAPYGRHTRGGWGPRISGRAAWVFMEIPAVVVFAGCFLAGNGLAPGIVWLFVALWEIHYVHRTFIFPFRLHEAGKTTPVLIVAFAVAFNVFNGYVNGRYLGVGASTYDVRWLEDPRFLIGVGLFIAGTAGNLWSDRILINLRQPGETDYKIPRGGLFRWVSCPNYLSETLKWIGWAIATWSLPGLVFAVWTMANLVPRALAHHRWYRRQFPDYPRERKALVPFLF
jgi:protein-S-isoprenylcysteine O-methyltransferase Ste14